MDTLPEDLFSDPVWHALHSKHRHLAILGDRACRYPRDVAPFAAVAAGDAASMAELRALLEPGEQVWLSGEGYAAAPDLVLEDTLTCLQLALPRTVDLPATSAAMATLGGENAPEMVALTDVAFPGFFRPRTCDMGAYYGIRVDGVLVSMGGERLMLDGYPEISGICTHPRHRGRGFAESIIRHIVRLHRGAGLVSWMHVVESNERALALYRRMGFVAMRRVTLSRICRMR
jgi:ribosomal protein S18 acetylase RimI-like enzyme